MERRKTGTGASLGTTEREDMENERCLEVGAEAPTPGPVTYLLGGVGKPLTWLPDFCICENVEKNSPSQTTT